MVRTVAGRLVRSGRVGLLPAAYNPPTVAHVALADAAQRAFGLDQVVYVLAEAMPHKRVERPGFQERLRWLSALAADQPRLAAAACGPGLVIEMVQAFRDELGPACDIFVISGRDAAERCARWDYGTGMPFAEQLRHFRLVVAARDGEFRVDAEHEGRILLFRIDPRPGEASSTAVRDAVRKGAAWRDHVPPAIRDAVGEAYGRAHAMTGGLVVYQQGSDGDLFRRRGLLAELRRQLRSLEAEYARDVERIRKFERRYRPAVGVRYDELEHLRERTSRGWEALGNAQSGAGPGGSAAETQADEPNRPVRRPGSEARRLFLSLARQIHPDLATDEDERKRRHEFMAEATLAYRDNDSHRLQWLLEHWQAESEPILGFGRGSQWARTNRQIAWARYRIREVQYSLGQLHSAPVARIMQEHDAARASGRNLILEMRKQIQAELEEAYLEDDRLRAALADLPPDLRTAVEAECGL